VPSALQFYFAVCDGINNKKANNKNNDIFESLYVKKKLEFKVKFKASLLLKSTHQTKKLGYS